MTKHLSFIGGSVDITPTDRIPLAGYASRMEAFIQVADRLEANIAILSDGARRIIIVSTDLLYVGKELSRSIKDKLGGAVNESELFLSASHTHYAPATDTLKPRLGEARPDYIQFVSERIAASISRMLSEKMSEVDAFYSKSSSPDSIINRMNHGIISLFPPRFGILPNPSGFKDERIHLLTVIGSDGLPKAVIWSYGCHPVNFYELRSVSPDFPGVIREDIRQSAGQRVPVLFLQGFSGDVRPDSNPETRKPGSKPIFSNFDEARYRKWAGIISKKVIDSMKSGPGKPLAPTVMTKDAEIPLADIGLQGGEPLRFKSIDIGEVKIIGVSAEPVAEYAPIFQNHFPAHTVIPVGCMGHVFGYLPTSSMLNKEEYETIGFQEFFNVSGRFNAEVQKNVEKAISSL